MKQIRELVGPKVGLLDLPADEARAIIQEQSYIVDHEPERALQTLPTLLGSAEERQRLLDLLDQWARPLELSAEQRALLPELRRILSPTLDLVPGGSSTFRGSRMMPQQSRAGLKPVKEGSR